MKKFNDISYKYIKYNKKRSRSIIIAIIISIFLIFGVGTLGLGVYNSLLDKSKTKGDYVVIFNNVSTNKYNDLKESKDISSISTIDILTVDIPQKKVTLKL